MLGTITLENTTRHFKLEGSVFKETMLGITATIGGISIPAPFDYEDHGSLFQFPLNYLDQDSSYGRLVLDFNDLGVVFKQSNNSKRINTVDGWGSLSTPYGDFPEVLRMRTVIERTDTTFLDATPIAIPTSAIFHRGF